MGVLGEGGLRNGGIMGVSGGDRSSRGVWWKGGLQNGGIFGVRCGGGRTGGQGPG